MSWLLEPWSYAFFARAVAAGVAVGALTGAVGVFVVLRRMSYIGHGLSHSLLGGIAVALALDWDLYTGAVAATVVTALLVDRVARRPGLAADAAIGIVTTGMFAAGVVVLSVAEGPRANAESLLFGSILGVRQGDFAIATVVALLAAAVLFAQWKRLVFTAFDPSVAAVQGVRAGALEALLNVLVAATVVVGVRLLGVLLVAAAVVVPAATARVLSHRIGRVLGIAVAAGIGSQVAGLYVSWHLDLPSGPAVVLVAVFLFLSAISTSSILRRGRLARARRARGGPGAALARAPDQGAPDG